MEKNPLTLSSKNAYDGACLTVVMAGAPCRSTRPHAHGTGEPVGICVFERCMKSKMDRNNNPGAILCDMCILS